MSYHCWFPRPSGGCRGDDRLSQLLLTRGHGADSTNSLEDTDGENDGGDEGDEVGNGYSVDIVGPGSDAGEAVLDLEQADVEERDQQGGEGRDCLAHHTKVGQNYSTVGPRTEDKIVT